MNISDKEQLGKLKFKYEKLQRECEDLQDSLTKQKIINKSELALNHDLKQIIETMKLQSNSLLEVIDHYSKRIIKYRNHIDILINKND
tara:strand:+ start:508 stop:771 length:264 start_codon:yes stop_codon:yes gene_type:complete